jgi:predicted dehydrogenase
MKAPKLAIIGTGNIANFHCHAFKKAGFEISHAAGSPNSKNITAFGKYHNIKKIYANPYDVLKHHSEWDVILLAPPIEKNFDYLDQVIQISKPTLIEKPVAINPESLSSFSRSSHEFIRVAYNRRFYSTVQRAKEFISKEDVLSARMELPERVNETGNYYAVHANSAHGIDLLYYLFKDIKVLNNYHLKEDLGRHVILESENGVLINLLLNWNAPSNFQISLETRDKKLEIKPFEDSRVFQGMDVIEPSDELPLRRYEPKIIESVSSFPQKNNLVKPGFLEQAMEMKGMLEGRETEISATLFDAFKTQELIKTILHS